MTARVLTAILAVLFVVLAFDAGAAHAQGAVAPVDAKLGPAPDFDPPRSATTAGKTVSKRDSVASPAPGAPTNAAAKRTKGGMAFAFWGFAALTVLGSLFVITRRNLITAVMGMVGTFFALAALYMLLYAHFLAIIQMLVYAGAIMVLFVFVIMILNKPEDEPFALSGRVGKVLAGLAMAYLVFRIGSVLIDVPAHVTMAQNAAPARTAAGDVTFPPLPPGRAYWVQPWFANDRVPRQYLAAVKLDAGGPPVTRPSGPTTTGPGGQVSGAPSVSARAISREMKVPTGIWLAGLFATPKRDVALFLLLVKRSPAVTVSRRVRSRSAWP